MWKKIWKAIKAWLESIDIETSPSADYEPEPDIKPALPPPDENVIKAVMVADAVCDRFCRQHYAEGLKRYREAGIDTIVTMADMETRARGFTRDYVEWGRRASEPASLLIENIGILESLGYRVIIIGLNTWAARHSCTQYIGSIQKAGVSEAQMYAGEALEREIQFYRRLLDQVNVYGIMPVLESQRHEAAAFVRELAVLLRDLGFDGPILLNGPKIKASDRERLGMWTAHSINNPDRWKTSQNDLRNSDGMYKLTRGRPDLVKMVWENPGPHGSILWSRDFVGHGSEPGRLYPEYMP